MDWPSAIVLSLLIVCGSATLVSYINRNKPNK